MNNAYEKEQITPHPSFKEILESNKMNEVQKMKASSWALALATIANVVDILSFFVMPQFFGLLFIALKGMHLVILVLAAIGFGIVGLMKKDITESVIALILGVVALWPFVVYDLIGVFFLGKPLFVF